MTSSEIRKKGTDEDSDGNKSIENHTRTFYYLAAKKKKIYSLIRREGKKVAQNSQRPDSYDIYIFNSVKIIIISETIIFCSFSCLFSHDVIYINKSKYTIYMLILSKN